MSNLTSNQCFLYKGNDDCDMSLCPGVRLTTTRPLFKYIQSTDDLTCQCLSYADGNDRRPITYVNIRIPKLQNLSYAISVDNVMGWLFG